MLLRESQLAWERAEWEDIKHVVNFWTLISLIGNVFIFVYTIRCLFILLVCMSHCNMFRIIFFFDNLSAHLYLKVSIYVCDCSVIRVDMFGRWSYGGVGERCTIH